MSAPRPVLGVGVLGAGTVGSQVVRILQSSREDFAARSGAEMEVRRVLVRNVDAPRDAPIDRELLTTDPAEAIDHMDLVVELIGGIETARTLVLRALNQGISVVTGNKALLAAHGPELYEAAASNGADLYYEAAVAGAVPVVYGLRESLAGDRITTVMGIVNGTTNFILDAMSTKGLSYEDALKQAQDLGFAEADPTADVEGFDAAAKCSILASLAFHTRVGIDDVAVEGISNITKEDMEEAARVVSVQPPAPALLYAQDKLQMRARLSEMGIPCPAWARVDNAAELERFGAVIGWPLIVKTPRGGYDVHVVAVAHSPADVESWWGGGSLLAEALVPFTGEVAALLARTPSGEVASWPVASTVQVDGVCAEVTAPAIGIRPETAAEARRIGERIASELGVTGVLAVEMFVVGEGADERVLVNELAMRPHNTGHWTIDGAVTSQFEQHLRAVLDLPLGSTQLRAPGTHVVMVNLLGSSHAQPARALAAAFAAGGTGSKVHLYGKEVRPGRKLGHVTVVDADPALALERARAAVNALKGETPTS